MKHIYLLFCLVIISVSAHSQESDSTKVKPWVLSGVTGLNLTQTSFSNWSAGGENSFAGNVYLNGTLQHRSGPWLWASSLILEYGLTNTKSQSTQKSSDKIDFSTQLGYTTDNKWFYTVMADFKSQFYKGYNYPNKDHYISKFMAPGYSNLSVGIEYRPNDVYWIYMSPVAGKFTFVRDTYLSDLGSFGVDPGDKFKSEFGAYLKAQAKKTLMENVTLITKADFFTAYNSSFGNVDVEWDVLINMKINKVLSASVNTTLKYDDDIKYINKDGVSEGPKVQFKEMIGVGVAYNF